MDNIEKEIRDSFSLMHTDLASLGFWQDTWDANSQYGFPLKKGFCSKKEAEQFVIDYYSIRMNLIRQ